MHISSKIYIQNLIKKNNSSGSILFYGLNNGPKFSLAHYAIQMLNCYQLKNQEPCGVCSACVKLKALNHPDLHIILPLPNEKKIDGRALAAWKKHIIKNNQLNFEEWKRIIASELGTEKEPSIGSEKISQISSILKLRNFEAKKRIVLIWHAEKLNTIASNKILKMLEEPPDKTYFIFVASDKDELIDTVKSRLEGIHVKEKISAQISETPNRNKDLDYAFAINTEESPANENFKKFQTWMRACHSKNIVELNDLNLEISKRKKGGYLSFMTFCVNKLSFCCRYVVQNKDDAQSNEEMVFIRKFCKHLKLKTLVLLLEEIESSIYYLERNANSKILFLSLSINLFKIFDEN